MYTRDETADMKQTMLFRSRRHKPLQLRLTQHSVAVRVEPIDDEAEQHLERLFERHERRLLLLPLQGRWGQLGLDELRLREKVRARV